jgi:uncharacterized membrane protein
VWRNRQLQSSFASAFPWSVALDVNDHGLVLGVGRAANRVQSAWIWDGRQLRTVPLPRATTLFGARRINEHGDVVGTVQDAHGLWFAARWLAPQYVPRLLPPATGDSGSVGHGLRDDAVAIGASDLADNSAHLPVLWDRQGHVHVLPALDGPAEAWVSSNAGDIAGYGWTGRDQSTPVHAFLWDGRYRLRDLGELPDSNDTKAFGISESSWVVGSSALDDADGKVQTSHGWVWPHQGPLVPLPIASREMSIAHDVIESGAIVGQVGEDLDVHGHAALWTCHA